MRNLIGNINHKIKYLLRVYNKYSLYTSDTFTPRLKSVNFVKSEFSLITSGSIFIYRLEWISTCSEWGFTRRNLESNLNKTTTQLCMQGLWSDWECRNADFIPIQLYDISNSFEWTHTYVIFRSSKLLARSPLVFLITRDLVAFIK